MCVCVCVCACVCVIATRRKRRRVSVLARSRLLLAVPYMYTTIDHVLLQNLLLNMEYIKNWQDFRMASRHNLRLVPSCSNQIQQHYIHS
jgi:hypothetical protein